MTINDLLIYSNSEGINLALLIVRLFIGVCFVIHGLGKLGLIGPGNMQGFIAWLESMNIPFAKTQARMAMLSEIIGGTLLTVGCLTRPAAFLLFSTMIVAGWIGHKGGGYLITNDPPGREYTVNLAVICLMYLITGPGTYSLDHIIFG